MGMTCPHCGAATDRPQLFSITRQRVFNYIWDHPGCTKAEIESAIYGSHPESTVVISHIHNIRNVLRGTKYLLLSIGVREKAYSIVPATATTNRAQPNASV